MMKRTIIFLCISFVLTSNALAQFDTAKYAVIPENPRPGDPVTIGMAANAKSAVLIAGGRQLTKTTFFPVPSDDETQAFMAAVISVPSTAAVGDAVIKVESDDGEFVEIPITIANRKFESEIIELNAALTSIRAEPDPQKTAEANLLWRVLATTGSEVYHTGKFVLPLTTNRRTSFYGDRRVFKYSNGKSDTSIHGGVDIGAPTGTKIFACGTGRAALARFRITTGNTIILEHAPGIYSLYYHLSKIDITEGAIVRMGELLGEVGATGLATGPHLHWELRVSTENTDPDVFVNRPIVDKDAILSKIRD